MQKEIHVADKNIPYTLRVSDRAKHLRLAIYCNGEVVVTQPRFLKSQIVDNFIKAKTTWIAKKLEYFKNSKSDPRVTLTRRDYLNNREAARILIKARLEYFNDFYKFKYAQVNIRDQKTRWGSCSRHGNLNFNFRLLFCSAPLRDYVIVHELCHLKELNHSRRFWDLVAQTIPNWQELRKNLKVN